MYGLPGPTTQPTGILAAVVAGDSKATRERMIRNMAVVRSQGFAVEWAVVVYDGPQDLAPWVDVRVAANYADGETSAWAEASIVAECAPSPKPTPKPSTKDPTPRPSYAPSTATPTNDLCATSEALERVPPR